MVIIYCSTSKSLPCNSSSVLDVGFEPLITDCCIDVLILQHFLNLVLVVGSLHDDCTVPFVRSDDYNVFVSC